ncbi:MAG: RadC family protein [Ruminiclostridium sp.]|nr:RadC family protein [Ruminiclostridium sp.]
MEDDKNVHHGHRSRMKAAMLEHGLDGLNDHQILELLLFYAIPKRDTNPIAHRLVERFGSLRGVLEADYDELRKVNGIADNAASLIKFSQLLSGRYLRSASFEGDTAKFSSTDSLRMYFEGAFLGVRTEQVRAMLVDDSLCMIKEQMLMEGTIGSVELSARKFTDFVVKNDSNRIVIAHNHPNGLALPSKDDIEATKELYAIFEKLDITLLDHIIVGRSGSCSMRFVDGGRSIWLPKRR